jgi:hypothetical protein
MSGTKRRPTGTTPPVPSPATITEANPARYRRLSEPFPDQPTTLAALNEFYRGVAVLRERHRLPDVHVLVWVHVRDAAAEGGEDVARSSKHYGDTLRAAPMLAEALGREVGRTVAELHRVSGLGRRSADAEDAEAVGESAAKREPPPAPASPEGGAEKTAALG